MKRFAVLSLLSLISLPTSADVTVRIIDYPAQVLRYSPVFVTVRIENHGAEPVLVPATNSTESRYFFDIGNAPDTLSEFRPTSGTTTIAGTVVWLKSGDSWLFRMDLGSWMHDLGPHLVRAGVQSTGQCQYRQTGAEPFPLKQVLKAPGVELYECWKGRSVSDTVRIEVLEPYAATDRAALDYVRSPEFPVSCCSEGRLYLRFQFGVQDLIDRFPTSHYTYVGAFYSSQSCPECLQRLLKLQPGNPLNPYTRLQLAFALHAAGGGEALTPSFIRELKLPPALAEYLQQRTRDSK